MVWIAQTGVTFAIAAGISTQQTNHFFDYSSWLGDIRVVNSGRNLEKELEKLEKEHGSEHPSLVPVLEELSVLHWGYTKAKSLCLRALAIVENLKGESFNEYDHLRLLYVLGEIERRWAEYNNAELYYRRYIENVEKKLGSEHRVLAHGLTALAGLYELKGDYKNAESNYKQAIAMLKEADSLGIPVNHAKLPLTSGFSLESRSSPDDGFVGIDDNHYRHESFRIDSSFEILRYIATKANGLDDAPHKVAAHRLAVLYAKTGNYQEIETLYHHYLKVPLSLRIPSINEPKRGGLYTQNRRVESVSPLDSYLAKLAESFIILNNYEVAATLYRRAIQVAEESSQAPGHLATLLSTLARLYMDKGDLAKAEPLLQRTVEVLEKSLGPEHGDVASAISNLGYAYIKQRDYARAEPLYLRALAIEEKLLGLNGLRVGRLEAVQSAIPPRSALVEFASYRPLTPSYTKEGESFGKPRYAAYILRSKGDPGWVELGDAQEIDRQVDALREALRDPERQDSKRLARALDERVMRPIRKLTRKSDRVFISPEGSLNLLPFGALVDEQDRYLVERHSFTYLTTGRDLLRSQERAQGAQGTTIIANPNFGGQTTSSSDRGMKVVKGGEEQKPSSLSKVFFTPLPGTAEEVTALSSIIPDAKTLTKSEANEAALKKISSPSILHIATHGFFLEDIPQTPRGESRGLRLTISATGDEPSDRAARGMFVRPAAMDYSSPIENPLLRSGLALAGANLKKSGDDDGILTAMEATALNLWGTKLVVLSACDTGVGEIRNGDGVYGLRRALVLAGSESQVMSLWPVDDEATRDLMVAYYKRLLAGEGRSEALRQVQLGMLASKNRIHPYYWAGFIQSGKWANLEGKR